MRYLYIAEKPSTMKAVKEVYQKSDQFLGAIDFFALAGHVCGLLEPKEYFQWKDCKWTELPLPLIPEPFSIGIKNKEIVKKLKAQLLSKKYDALIVGTDSDVEGNGIFDLLAEYLGLRKYPTYRFFEKDLTPKGILDSLHSLTDYYKNPRDVRMSQAFFIRSRFDWLTGFNMTIAYTIKSGFLMRVGRVKAPTLKLVYDNCRAIGEFQETQSFLPVIKTENPCINACLIDEEGKEMSFPSRSEADQLLAECGPTAVVKKIEKKKVSHFPAKLYKLSDIQVEAGQKYGYSPDSVLEALQNLYEKYKVLSYPRTDCRYISSEKAKEFPYLLKPVFGIPGMEKVIRGLTQADVDAVRNNPRYVNDKEVEKASHDALIPTGKRFILDALPEREKNICTMVFKRFLSIFLPPLVEEKVRYILENDGHLFQAKGSTVVQAGFTEIFDRDPLEMPLPMVQEGKILNIVEKNIHIVRSRPPKRLTQALLIDAMENIQKYMKKGELKEVMKEVSGIGQQSSRASIITDLLRSGYIAEKNHGLYITDKGKTYIENLHGSSILDPELTARWELNMKHVREGSADYRELYSQILQYLKDTLIELEQTDISQLQEKKPTIDVSCPSCGADLCRHDWGYGCSTYPTCRFSIGKICEKMLTPNQVKALIEKGKTGVIKGFKGKNGASFEASLVYEDGRIRFIFPNRKK